MKYFKFLISIIFLGLVWSCGGDDDICESGEGTPRMRVMFKNSIGKTVTLDSLQVFVNYGSGKVDLGWKTNIDNVLIPVRVDDSPSTQLYFKTRKNSNESEVKVSYTTKSSYVSPGCGVKKNYENLSSELIISNPVLGVELGQNFIENEDKTNLYLLF
ncbi:hypothetical protein HNP38_002868 [Chryseobacterium defluvii]|uniref:Uncharacterized protein n=1 Tax=Chryseobacterium defluvii TaxID=160396 RepID=A0A840KL20_9FLAO|nr:DUF6452 family protein [Chryseobacterium defluvii]MBB4807562.1 hypothetical protein [Chryseobacterium defluvii]